MIFPTDCRCYAKQHDDHQKFYPFPSFSSSARPSRWQTGRSIGCIINRLLPCFHILCTLSGPKKALFGYTLIVPEQGKEYMRFLQRRNHFFMRKFIRFSDSFSAGRPENRRFRFHSLRGYCRHAASQSLLQSQAQARNRLFWRNGRNPAGKIVQKSG